MARRSKPPSETVERRRDGRPNYGVPKVNYPEVDRQGRPHQREDEKERRGIEPVIGRNDLENPIGVRNSRRDHRSFANYRRRRLIR